MNKIRAGIVAIAKNEDPYLLEWAAYHLSIGFDHIWIYDNESTNPISNLLSKFKSRKFITVVPWPNSKDGRTQLNAYNHYLVKFGANVDWTAVIDIDELICLKKDKTINEFLKRYEDCSGIALNWRFFGSSGQISRSDGLMMERFTRASLVTNGANQGIKSVHKTAAVEYLMPHYSLYKNNFRVVSTNGSEVPNDWRIAIDPSNFELAQVNHYFVKSLEEWNNKIARHNQYSTDDRAGYFDRCDLNDLEDATLLESVDRTRAWMRRIAASRLEVAIAQLNSNFGSFIKYILAMLIRSIRKSF